MAPPALAFHRLLIVIINVRTRASVSVFPQHTWDPQSIQVWAAAQDWRLVCAIQLAEIIRLSFMLKSTPKRPPLRLIKMKLLHGTIYHESSQRTVQGDTESDQVTTFSMSYKNNYHAWKSISLDWWSTEIHPIESEGSMMTIHMSKIVGNLGRAQLLGHVYQNQIGLTYLNQRTSQWSC